MPRKLRELRADLHKAEFTMRHAPGSHEIWKHERFRDRVVLAGADGADAKPYQERDVRIALREIQNDNA